MHGYQQDKINYLIEGSEFGFSLHFEGARESFQAINLLSCFDNPDVVDKKSAKELAAHWLAGPFADPPSYFTRFSFGRGTQKDSE